MFSAVLRSIDEYSSEQENMIITRMAMIAEFKNVLGMGLNVIII